jgi:uncharacterized membrane protein YuzA (DUF378 family)
MKMVAYVLVLIGGLNWLLVGVFGGDLGSWLLGGMDSVLSKIVYILVGLSAILLIVKRPGTCCSSKKEESAAPESNPMDSQM